MEVPDVVNAKWWVELWEGVEHWAFLTAVLVIALQFPATHLVKSPRRIVDHARELEIAEANARAEEAQADLAKFRAPRSLSPEQKALVVAATSPFPGTPFDFAIQTDPEPIALMEQISVVSRTQNGQEKNGERAA